MPEILELCTDGVACCFSSAVRANGGFLGDGTSSMNRLAFAPRCSSSSSTLRRLHLGRVLDPAHQPNLAYVAYLMTAGALLSRRAT